uniref:Alpha/beta hydrolase n=1 Tax=Roseihalotalea indica TaxID=2867963 RepID=A0AA49GQL6_9BACT|nr:alpha/beta hydrolase [Tunicatimonas sp. TK19036]
MQYLPVSQRNNFLLLIKPTGFVFRLLLCLLILGSFAQEASARTSGYTEEFNIPYCTVDGKTLTLNAFLPADTTKVAPVMVDIHGGWWSGGSPATEVSNTFTDKGIAVFSIRYRLGQEGGFPQNIRDCRNAIRFIRKNAARFHIDPDRIGVMGGSAGGHLSLMVAMVPEDFDDGGPTEGLEGISANVINCFSFIAPTDFLRFWNEGPDDEVRAPDGTITYRAPDESIPNDSRPRFRVLFHGIVPDSPANKALYTRMSPMAHVRKKLPPLLICDGELDPIVPGLEGKALYKALTIQGADATYWMTLGGGHAYPGGEGFQQILDDFLTRTLSLNSR